MQLVKNSTSSHIRPPVTNYMLEAAADYAIKLMEKIGDRKAAAALGLREVDFYRLVSKDFFVDREMYTKLLRAFNKANRGFKFEINIEVNGNANFNS